jgi:hypothetical protein
VLAHGGCGVKLYEFPIWQRFPALTFARSAARGGWEARGEAQPQGRPILVRTDDFLALKGQAIRAYESQLDHFPLGFLEDFSLPFETFVHVAPRRQPPN